MRLLATERCQGNRIFPLLVFREIAASVLRQIRPEIIIARNCPLNFNIEGEPFKGEPFKDDGHNYLFCIRLKLRAPPKRSCTLRRTSIESEGFCDGSWAECGARVIRARATV